MEARIVAGQWTAPKEGEAMTLPDGASLKWEPLRAASDGSFSHASLNGGYAYIAVSAPAECVRILEASGHGLVYVNGEPRPGDPYQHGYVKLPVLLRKGVNDLLFQVARGKLQAKLVEPKGTVFIENSDTTLPDLVTGRTVKTWGAMLIANATKEKQDHLLLVASLGTGGKETVTPLPLIAPLSVRKVGFRIEGPARAKEGPCALDLKLSQGEGDREHPLAVATLRLDTRRPEQTRKETFVSNIDGSVQYFAIVPAKNAPTDPQPGLVLTLHGAAVEALGQAQSYAPKAWVHLVAPTNRRPFGFDWEDWGRWDAMEVLDLAQKQLHTDPARTYLTGHSMGGHGTWHLGVTFPDRFAAIGPSAGWVSMWSYAGAQRSDGQGGVRELLARTSNPSDTLALAGNTRALGIYVLHGDKDDNVPVEQARIMKQHLSAFHKDLEYFEEPGAGHWWGKPGIAGAACVDWPPMFDFFRRHTLPPPAQIRQVDFVTANPAVSARANWMTIETQLQPLRFSSAHVRWDPEQRLFSGTTENVARLALDVAHVTPDGDMHVELDGCRLSDIHWPAVDKRLWLERTASRWVPVPRPALSGKGPHRSGPFKEAFRNRVQFVYGTRGSAAENAWAFAKARLDAETFWYRGNGSIDVIADTAFDASAEPQRNVVVYGNADTNAAWPALLASSPVQVRRGALRIGGHEETSAELGCLFLRPRPGSDESLVGAVTGTGVVGMRLIDRLPYFISGVEYPDCLIVDPSVLSKGVDGVRSAGFFGPDWSVERGEFAWRK
jgi:pimeloyl-ACP methyl ester carboxylesterase